MRQPVLPLLLALALLCFHPDAGAQRFSIGTNAADWLSLGTLNASGSAAIARHLTLTAEARVNPWSFRDRQTGAQMQNRHQTYAFGLHWWPWYIYSGWWLGLSGQYQEYNRGGVLAQQTEEGDAYGAAFSAGYTVMLHEHLNLEVGAAGWGGFADYTVYACPRCGRVTDAGRKWFVRPSELVLSLVWIF